MSLLLSGAELFVVLRYSYEDTRIVGLFSTREKARDKILDYIKEHEETLTAHHHERAVELVRGDVVIIQNEWEYVETDDGTMYQIVRLVVDEDDGYLIGE